MITPRIAVRLVCAQLVICMTLGINHLSGAEPDVVVQAQEDDPYKVPIVPPVANPNSPSALAWEADAPTDDYERFLWRDARMKEALARQLTVTDSSGGTAFPDDDSLTAYFWRRHQKANYLENCAYSQFEMNVSASQASASLKWMLDAMLAEIRLLNADSPEMLEALDASQKAWADYANKQYMFSNPPSDEDRGSSAMMVYHHATMPAVFQRIRELMPWVMGLDSSGGKYLDTGSLSYDYDIAYQKEKLRAFGLWPLRPENIGASTAYGDSFMQEVEESIEARTAEWEKSRLEANEDQADELNDDHSEDKPSVSAEGDGGLMLDEDDEPIVPVLSEP